jgi:hypothetical protein
MQYNTGTVNIDLQGDIAHVESYVWAAKKMHELSENGLPLMRISGVRYVDRFERRAGEWRIAERWFVPEWGFFHEVPPLTKSVGVILAPQDMKLKPIPSQRFPDDISYTRVKVEV